MIKVSSLGQGRQGKKSNVQSLKYLVTTGHLRELHYCSSETGSRVPCLWKDGTPSLADADMAERVPQVQKDQCLREINVGIASCGLPTHTRGEPRQARRVSPALQPHHGSTES
jgi:hypothetical protein